MRQLLKSIITICTLVTCMTGANAFSADSGQKRSYPLDGEVIKLTDLKKEIRTITSDKNYKTVKPKSFKNKKRYAKEVALIKKYRKLNRKVLKKNVTSDTQVMSYVGEYEQLAKQMNRLVAAGDYEEGIGACISECRSELSGVGGGVGAARFFCSAACIVHGQ